MKEAVEKALQNAKKYIDAGDLDAAKKCIDWVLEEINADQTPVVKAGGLFIKDSFLSEEGFYGGLIFES